MNNQKLGVLTEKEMKFIKDYREFTEVDHIKKTYDNELKMWVIQFLYDTAVLDGIYLLYNEDEFSGLVAEYNYDIAILLEEEKEACYDEDGYEIFDYEDEDDQEEYLDENDYEDSEDEDEDEGPARDNINLSFEERAYLINLQFLHNCEPYSLRVYKNKEDGLLHLETGYDGEKFYDDVAMNTKAFKSLTLSYYYKVEDHARIVKLF